MASKKLKLEVDLETTKAKRQLAGMADGASASPVDSAAEKTARALEKATKGAKDLGESATKTSVNMKEAVSAFSGLAIGMAANYSARFLEEGSTARNAVEYGSSALMGGVIGGKVAGPWGAAAGGAIGLAKTYFDKSGEQAQALKDFETSERRYSEARAWKSKFDSMSTGDMETELARLKSAETKIATSVRQFAEQGQLGNANHQKESLSLNRQWQAQLESAIKSKKDSEGKGEQRNLETAVDALSRVGGYFAGAGSGDALLRTSREQVDILRAIERKTGATTWQ